MAVDWLSIRAEYISTRISTRDLAQKHEVSYSTLRKRAEKEQWSKERESQRRKISAKVALKTAEALSSQTASATVKMLAINDKLINLLSKTVDALEKGKPNPYKVKVIVSAQKDLAGVLKATIGGDIEADKLDAARKILGVVPSVID